MNNSRFFLCVAPLLLASAPLVSEGASPPSHSETYEHGVVEKIVIDMQTKTKNSMAVATQIRSRLKTKVGDPFSQLTFDHDLKELSDRYDRVEPTIKNENGNIYITLQIWERPIISSISWSGNRNIRTSKLRSLLDIQPYTEFDKGKFNDSINAIREYYIKKGYFESSVTYRIIPNAETNEIQIDVIIDEGHSGHISSISFDGFTKQEQSELLDMINSKKYNFFTSWLTGKGKYHDEIIEQDKLIITNFLQNEGYADARVHIEVEENREGKLEITITAVKGEKYTIEDIRFEGNILYNEYDIQKDLTLKPGSVYSPDAINNAVDQIKDLYGKDGYIDLDVRYTLDPLMNDAKYNLTFSLHEGHQYKIGILRVLGNVNTKSNVILRESLLVPGELFDTRKLKATQERLMATGYFKSVNVYPVRTEDDESLGDTYRDVIIEVDETATGNISLFFGLSTADSAFGGIDFSENNFNHRGLLTFWKKGISELRGGGEFFSGKISVGRKQQDYSITWVTPYLNDSLWRLGFDVSYGYNGLQSNDYDTRTMGGSVFASYPLTQYVTYGMKLRARNALIDVNSSIVSASLDERNSGLVVGYGNSIGYDSTDNPFKPHRGFRSALEGEIAVMDRHSKEDQVFPFLKFGFINTYYYPVWRLGTFKVRADGKFTYPLGEGKPDLMPFSERYYLGGDQSLRGYVPYIIGPKLEKKNAAGETFESNDPSGGVTSVYLSGEYMQTLHPMLDLFTFFDCGTITQQTFTVQKFNMSYGFGARIDIGNRLPLTVGYGIPINPDNKKNDVRNFFFTMGGQF